MKFIIHILSGTLLSEALPEVVLLHILQVTMSDSVRSESPYDVDFSVIRTAIDMGHSMIEQILHGIHYGSEEVRNLLYEECDYVVECKVCRNLFRSFPNFVAHKRVYCQETHEEKLDREKAVLVRSDEEAVIVEPEAPVDIGTVHFM